MIYLILVCLGIGLAWYLLITTEGVYLGRGVVIWLYDVYASRYDRIKQFNRDFDQDTLAAPILRSLRGIPEPIILDVATGTGRLPVTLLDADHFHGSVIGLDYSLKMLRIAAAKLEDSGVAWIYQTAEHLPFPDGTFDAVTSLEALEFTPDPDAVITEMIRVLRPGGLLLISNRRGVEARLMPLKTRSTRATGVLLRDRFGLEDVSLTRWLVNYDLLRGRKPGGAQATTAPDLVEILCCSKCGGQHFKRVESALCCPTCGHSITVTTDGIVMYAHP
jgi:SAM-dependent methyltransferase